MQKELVFSFTLALAVVGGALWMLDGPLTHGMKRASTDTAPSPPTQQPPSTFEQAVPNNMASQPEASVRDSSAALRKINKCVLDGKTIYSDEKCPTGAEVNAVALHDAAGIVSPPKAVLSELTAQRKAAERAAERESQQRVARTTQSNRDECQRLDKWIEHLDSLARQPQSGQTQDWIKEQRAAARNRQFAIHC